jgi:hypothetical protein
VPLISIKTTASPIPVLTDNYFTIAEQPVASNINNTNIPSLNTINTPGAPFSVKQLLQFIYLLLTGLLLLRFISNIYRLLSKVSKNKTINYKGAKLVLLPENTVSYTFLNNIFIAEADYVDHTIEDELIVHELSHVQQKHSVDIIFIEILQALFWFNPLFIFYKKAIQLNHEFLADDAVIKTFENIPAYQFLLFEKASANSNSYLASAFNYSVTKKRLVMMTRKYNQRVVLLKKALIFPLLITGLFFFSTKPLISQEKKEPAHELANDTSKVKKIKMLRVLPWDIPITNPNGVSKELIEEYNALVESKVSISNEKKQTPFNLNPVSSLSKTERNRLLEIYRQMNLEQRYDAKVGFEKRSEPQKKHIPTAAQLEKWKNPADYGVWIDGKKVTNDQLNSYKASDFSYYDASNLAYTDKMKKNVMETFNLKVMYKVQLDLMTNQGYDKYYKTSMAQPEFAMFYHITRNGNRDVEWRNRIKIN